MSDWFSELCKENGVIHMVSMPPIPEQNRAAERRNRTLLNMVRSMLALTNLLIFFFWVMHFSHLYKF